MLALLAFIPGKAKLVGGIILVLAIVALVAFERAQLINKGAQEATRKIEDANVQSENRADIGSDRVDHCFAAGGTWNRDNRVCDYPAGRPTVRGD